MNAPVVDEQSALIDLLVEWEEHRRRGIELSPESLCPGNPDLQQQLRERINRRLQLRGLFDSPTIGESEPPTSAPPLPEVAGYEILGVIGHGGMGVVYQARQLGLNRIVALKMVLAGANASPQSLARFRSEAESVAQLAHPSIVQIYEIGEQDGCPYLALEYVSGGSLAQHLDGTPIAPRPAAELVLALARAVQHAHERGVVHRDLKPANVLLLANGTPKITDFGLAKRADANQAHTQTGALLGSPTYMAPEQASGATDKIGPATDIYALGVILYELLTGRPPFRGASLIETIEQVREHEPAPLRTLAPKTPRDLETICLKCLEKSPARRYATAADLAADLHAFLHGDPINAQSVTLLDQVARTISHHSFDARFRGFANRMLVFAPVPLAVHLVAFAFFVRKPYYPIAMVVTTAGMLFTLVPALIITGTTTLRNLPAWQKRHFMTVWIGQMIAMLVILFAVYAATPRERPEMLLMVYPLWATTAAMSFLAHATEAGMYYMVGAVLFCVAILTALTPSWAPLEVAFFMTANLTSQALYLRSLTREGGVQNRTSSSLASASTVNLSRKS
jgi:eukaryotic-like serine/threonine-protein kinase